jgi:cell wall-associated NlpC family hydrolase
LITSITRGDKVTYYEIEGEWARITTWTDKNGYVLAKYLVNSADKVEKTQVSRSTGSKTESSQPLSVEGQTLADKIVAYSKTLLGVPYVWAGYSTKGFDCSGFTKYVFAKFGISLPRSSYAYSSIGTKVSRSELQKGDILLWDTEKNGTVGHVGIYIGDGMFIHASSSKRKVVTRALSTYSEKYLGARRVIK